MNTKKIATIYAILAAALYAINVPLSKLLLQHADPTMMAAFLYLGAGSGLFLYGLIKKFTGKEMGREPLTRKELPYTIAMVAFEYAFKNDMVIANPCAKSQRPKKNAYYAGFYSKDELNQLLKVAKDDQLYVPITLAAYYGLRRSEVIGVKWSNIDFDAKRINIWHKVMQEEKEDGGTQIVGYDTMKNKSSRRTMPLIPAVEKILLEHKAKQEEYMKLFGSSYSKEYKDYVCVDPLGGIIKPNFVTDHFRHLLEEHGLKKIRFHDLRHTCASLLLANGISMKQIQEWLGHSDFSTTANIYAHLEYDTKLQSAEMMAKVIGYED